MFFSKRLNNDSAFNKIEQPLVDFHAHILPGIDDGSGSVEESLEMLRRSYSQGVRKIVATPHFYPQSISPDEFFSQRERALKLLSEAMDRQAAQGEAFPEVIAGVEVSFFHGMSRYERLGELCIGDTNLLMIEMPFSKWTDNVLDELIKIKNARGLVPIVAHIERYIFGGQKAVKPTDIPEGVIIQANSGAFLDRRLEGRMIRLLRSGRIDILGSDCHNLSNRAPDIGPALEKIGRVLGYSAAVKLVETGNRLI